MSSDEDIDQWRTAGPLKRQPTHTKSRPGTSTPALEANPKPSSPTDDLLIDTYRAYAGELTDGIRAAFGNGPPDPDDVAQEAFQKVYERGDYGSIRNLRAFLWRTARNIVLAYKRKSDVRTKYDFEVEQLLFSPKGDNSSPERIISAREQLTAINACLRDMPERRRRAFMLYRVEGLPMKEVAERLGISRTAATKHVTRADIAINSLFFDEA
ncbi:MAG: sigma-70 family RNA polymerase sigma factor [Pseudomonadota bacterium]